MMMNDIALIFSVDNKINKGVSVGQPASNREDNSATTPVRHVVFLRPELKGIPGSAANILNTRAAWLSAVTSSPVLLPAFLVRRGNCHV
jgi:hypothetical protein